MAEEVKKEKKPNVFSRMARSLKDMRGEVKKVVWPTKKQTINNTVVVLSFIAVMGAIIALFDASLSKLIQLMVGA